MSFTTNFQLIEQAQKYGLPLIGVFNKDELPQVPQQGFYIINLQDAEDLFGRPLEGTHWTVAYIEGTRACYFDSFGFPPPLELQYFLKPYAPYPYNRQQIQNERGGYCGVYVLWFMYFMVNNRRDIPNLHKRLTAFSRLWSPRVEDNLTRLKQYIRDKFPFQ